MIKEEYFDAGLKAYNNKNYSKAIDYFNQLIDTFSNSIGEEKLSETYYMRGICYAQEYSINEALEDFNEAEKLGFDKSKIYCGIGIAYAHCGKNKVAINYFTKAIELNKIYDEAYYRRGISYNFMLDFNSAIINFNKAIELKDDYYKYYYYRGIAFNHKIKYDKALKDLNKTIRLNDKFVLAFNYIGLVYYNIEDYDKALYNFNKAIELDENFNPAYNNRGLVYYRMGKEKYDKAFNDFDKAIELNDEFSFAYSNRGLIYYHKEDYDKAFNDFTEAIKLNDKLTVAYNNRGLIYYHKEDYDKAFDDLKKIKLDDTLNYMIKICLICKIDINKIENFPIEYADSYFRTIVQNITIENKNKLFKIWIYQYILLDLLSIKNYKNIKELSHYTSKNIFEKLISNDEENCNAYLRFTSISKANDPKEGEILKKLLSKNIKNNISITEKQNKDYLVLQTSFIRYTDFLTMFRLYGKEKEREGTGISLVFNNSFFDIDNLVVTNPSRLLVSTEDDYKNDIKSSSYYSKLSLINSIPIINQKKDKLPLYFVLYYDDEENELIYNPTDSTYQNEIINLNNLFDEDIEYDKNNSNITDNIKFVLKNIFIIIRNLKNEELELAYKLLINIRYLIKHPAFFEEQELRIIQLTKNNGSDVSFDKDINRLYSNYEIPIFEGNYLKKVIIGPKVEEASSLKEVYQHLIMKNKSNKNIDIEISELPLN